MSKENTADLDKLAKLLEKNLVFHVLLEKEVQETPFGQITFNFEVRGETVDLKTLNVVKNRRRRYTGSNSSID